MISDLTKEEALALLAAHSYAHVGSCRDDKPYVLPFTYRMHEGMFYSYTYDGLKIDMMRENPNICLQVEEMVDDANWKSAIAFGTFEEIGGDERIEVIKLLVDAFSDQEKYIPFNYDGTSKQHRDAGDTLVVWRLHPNAITGRQHTGE